MRALPRNAVSLTELKGYLSLEDGGVRPVRASSSQWIAHKWNAMKHVLSRYGTYAAHLASFSEDDS